MTDFVEAVVIGAGVVGLAVARALALGGRETMILEAADHFGMETSSRNSEVIHAGIYYPAGSLKAELCVAGRDMLYGYCIERGIPHRRAGKLIVATDEAQIPALQRIRQLAAANGVGDLQWLSGQDARAIEPALQAAAALLSPSTGIIDSHALMLALLGDAEAAGAMLVLRSPVVASAVKEDGFRVSVGGRDPMELDCRLLVNAAGLYAQDVAGAMAGLDRRHIPDRALAKRSYFTLSTRPPFSHLVYPVPEDGGLGVHLTLDMGGRGRFGPDVEWVDAIDYSVDPRRAEGFYAAIRRYWPDLPDHALEPGYAGIRPKLRSAGGVADFVIQGADVHGHRGLINLFGIESPGLTASLGIAEHVVRKLGYRS